MPKPDHEAQAARILEHANKLAAESREVCSLHLALAMKCHPAEAYRALAHAADWRQVGALRWVPAKRP